MVSTYSNLKIQLMGTGDNNTTWGDVTNLNLGTAIEEAVVGSADVTFASGNVTLTLTDTNASQTARNLRLRCTGTTAGARDLIVPAIEKAYIIRNDCADTITVKNATGTGAAVSAGSTVWVYNDGTNVASFAGTVTSVNASGGSTGLTFTGGPVTSSGTLTAGGTLAVASGGTGATTAASARVNLLPTYAGNIGRVLTVSSGGTDVEWATASAGTVTSVGGTGTVNGITLTGTVTSSGSLTLGGTLSGVSLTTQVSGTLPVGNGGTGLATTPTNGQLLIGNGTNFSLAALTAGANITVTNSAGGITIATSFEGDTDTATPFETSIGYQAGNVNTGVNNTFIGYQAGLANTTGTGNTAVGYQALDANTTGGSIVAVGSSALTANTTGFALIAVGSSALFSNTTGSNNVAVGSGALRDNTTGATNVAMGNSTLLANTTGQSNSAFGHSALNAVTTGGNNTAVGRDAGDKITTGQQNTLLGASAGSSGTNDLTTGSNNTLIGFDAAATSASVSNQITLGNSSIATLRCQVTTITSLSDGRDKTDVADLDAGLSFVEAMRPVRFTWAMRDGGKVGEEDTGFIAQDLQAAMAETGIDVPGLVYADNPDRLEAGYSKLLPILVKAIQELSAEVADLKAQIKEA